MSHHHDELSDNSGNVNPLINDIEVDKHQFLHIIQSAYSKIAQAMHPKIANPLNQLGFMYNHYIAQTETSF
jgi:hypothetical protein